MHVIVRLFAILRDKAGVSSVELDLQDGATVRDAADALNRKLPSITPFMSKAAYAVNREYQPFETELHDGDELAIIPPVSGG